MLYPIHSADANKPALDPKADKRQFFMLTHVSPLIALTRFLAGQVTSVVESSTGSLIGLGYAKCDLTVAKAVCADDDLSCTATSRSSAFAGRDCGT